MHFQLHHAVRTQLPQLPHLQAQNFCLRRLCIYVGRPSYTRARSRAFFFLPPVVSQHSTCVYGALLSICLGRIKKKKHLNGNFLALLLVQIPNIARICGIIMHFRSRIEFVFLSSGWIWEQYTTFFLPFCASFPLINTHTHKIGDIHEHLPPNEGPVCLKQNKV